MHFGDQIDFFCETKRSDIQAEVTSTSTSNNSSRVSHIN